MAKNETSRNQISTAFLGTASKNDPYSIWNFEKPIRFRSLAQGSSWGKIGIFETRVIWQRKCHRAWGLSGLDSSTITSGQLRGSQKIFFSSE